MEHRHKNSLNIYGKYLDVSQIKDEFGYQDCLHIIQTVKDRIQDYLEDNGIEYDNVVFDGTGLGVEPIEKQPLPENTYAYKMRFKKTIEEATYARTYDNSNRPAKDKKRQEYRHRDYVKNREKRKQQARESAKKNYEKNKEARKEYRKKNRERINASKRKSYARHRDEKIKRSHDYYVKNRDDILRRDLKRKENNYPCIIKQLYENNSSAIDELMKKYPFETFGQSIIKNILYGLWIYPNDAQYDDCYSVASLAYFYALYRCSYNSYRDDKKRVANYIARAVKPMVKMKYFQERFGMSMGIKKHHNMKLINLDDTLKGKDGNAARVDSVIGKEEKGWYNG